MTPALAGTLAMVAAALADEPSPWWVIGSAAVSLHGADPGSVADVDLLAGSAPARRLLDRLGVADTPRPDGHFRSMVFACWTAPPLPVEIMGDLTLRDGDEWRPVELRTREPVQVGGSTLFVPDRAELASLLDRFGRPKDRHRAAALRG